MNLIEIFSIILIHWFADFVLQTDWQAKNKSKNNTALTAHIIWYIMIWILPVVYYTVIYRDSNMWLFLPITFICHWVTDYFTSRLNSKLWSEGKVHNFFVSVGFDQVLHYVQLFTTYYYLKNG